MGCSQEDEGISSNPLWYVGVILSIFASIGTNMGVNLQKYSFMKEAKRKLNLKRSYAKQPLWVIGLLLVIIGSVVDFVALGFLPQSLATPVGGSTMIANVVFASLFLKEKFSRMDAIGTSLVLGGICLVAAFANKESDCYTLDELIEMYLKPLFIMYCVIMAVATILLYWLLKYSEKTLKKYGKSSVAYKRVLRIHPLTAPALSGILGGQSVLFAKSVAELIKTTANGENQFTNFGTYAVAISMFVCIFSQIHWLAYGLQFFDAVFVVPVFQCFFISISIFGGGVYFNEFASMSPLSLAMFFLGVGVTLFGVYFLSRRDMNSLKPIGKLRAAVQMVIFIKRAQKCKHMDYQWVISDPLDHKKQLNSQATTSSFSSGFNLGVKISKASVVPINSNATTTTTNRNTTTASICQVRVAPPGAANEEME